MKRRVSFVLMTIASLFLWDRTLYAVRAIQRPTAPRQAPAARTAPAVPAVGPAAPPPPCPALRIDLVPPEGWQDLPCVRRDLEVRGA